MGNDKEVDYRYYQDQSWYSPEEEYLQTCSDISGHSPEELEEEDSEYDQ